MSDKLTRRGFIDRTAKGAAALFALPAGLKVAGKDAADPLEKSRVVVVKHDNALKGSAFQQDVIRTMMNAGITSLTGLTDVGEAWKSLFPGITTTSIIAVKINCLFSRQPTHPQVTNAVLAGLNQMRLDGSPFPENNIIVWDMGDGYLQQCGYTINKTTTGVRFFGTSGYSSTVYKIDGGDDQRLSKIITDTCNYLINLSVLKNHSTGVSLSMKNHYGSINNLNGPHMHNYPLRTQLPSLNALAPIRQKQVVCICDAIRGVIENGPDASPQVSPKSIILSRDTVAHDTVGAQMLTDYGCNTSSLTGMACHVATAAQPPYNLGTCDLNQIELVQIDNPPENPSGVKESHETIESPDEFTLSHNYPNPFNSRTVIFYQLPKSANIRIFVTNVGGRAVRRLMETRQGPGAFQVVWDGKRDDGSQASSGMYLCVLETGRVRRAIKMQLIQ